MAGLSFSFISLLPTPISTVLPLRFTSRCERSRAALYANCNNNEQWRTSEEVSSRNHSLCTHKGAQSHVAALSGRHCYPFSVCAMNSVPKYATVFYRGSPETDVENNWQTAELTSKQQTDQSSSQTNRRCMLVQPQSPASWCLVITKHGGFSGQIILALIGFRIMSTSRLEVQPWRRRQPNGCVVCRVTAVYPVC